LHIARWPVVLSALIQVVLKVEKPYMITVKGIQRGNLRPFSLKPHLPYLLLTGISLVACWINLSTYGRSPTQGYLLFALQGAIAVTAVGMIALLNDIAGMIKEGVSVAKSIRLRIKPIVVLLLLIGSIAFTSGASTNRINEALTYKEETHAASDSHPINDNILADKLLAFP
jgi:cellulose synthase (UDP-forming)